MLKEICAALMFADVNVKMVFALRENLKKILKLDDMAGGVNKRRAIKKVRIYYLPLHSLLPRMLGNVFPTCALSDKFYFHFRPFLMNFASCSIPEKSHSSP